jgi:hypothetical protein
MTNRIECKLSQFRRYVGVLFLSGLLASSCDAVFPAQCYAQKVEQLGSYNYCKSQHIAYTVDMHDMLKDGNAIYSFEWVSFSENEMVNYLPDSDLVDFSFWLKNSGGRPVYAPRKTFELLPTMVRCTS